MGKGRIRIEERIKTETDEEIFEAKLLEETNKEQDENLGKVKADDKSGIEIE